MTQTFRRAHIYILIYLSITHIYRGCYIRTLTFRHTHKHTHTHTHSLTLTHTHTTVYPSITHMNRGCYIRTLTFQEFLGLVHVYSVTDRAHLTLVHKTPVEGVPRAICAFQVEFFFPCAQDPC
jgi:hypothetical protein